MHHKKCKNGVFRAFSLNKMLLLCGVQICNKSFFYQSFQCYSHTIRILNKKQHDENIILFSIKFTMKSFIYIPEISIYIFINIKISIKRCKNVEFFTKNALQTAKCKILFKIVEKVSKYEKNNTIHNGCWRSSVLSGSELEDSSTSTVQQLYHCNI